MAMTYLLLAFVLASGSLLMLLLWTVIAEAREKKARK